LGVLSFIVPIFVFMLASNLLYKMNSKENARNAIKITSSEQGEYLASKFGVKVKRAFIAWISTLCFSSAVNISLQFAPKLDELANYSKILRALSGLLITLQFVLAYEYISSAETLAQVCTVDPSCKDAGEAWSSMSTLAMKDSEEKFLEEEFFGSIDFSDAFKENKHDKWGWISGLKRKIGR
jgi:hypothetical protein